MFVIYTGITEFAESDITEHVETELVESDIAMLVETEPAESDISELVEIEPAEADTGISGNIHSYFMLICIL